MDGRLPLLRDLSPHSRSTTCGPSQVDSVARRASWSRRRIHPVVTRRTANRLHRAGIQPRRYADGCGQRRHRSEGHHRTRRRTAHPLVGLVSRRALDLFHQLVRYLAHRTLGDLSGQFERRTSRTGRPHGAASDSSAVHARRAVVLRESRYARRWLVVAAGRRRPGDGAHERAGRTRRNPRSTDGTRIVASLVDLRQSLEAISADTATPERRSLTNPFDGDVDPSVDPLSGRIVFSSARSGNRNLWIAARAGWPGLPTGRWSFTVIRKPRAMSSSTRCNGKAGAGTWHYKAIRP